MRRKLKIYFILRNDKELCSSNILSFTVKLFKYVMKIYIFSWKYISQNWVHQNTLPLSDKSTSPREGGDPVDGHH